MFRGQYLILCIVIILSAIPLTLRFHASFINKLLALGESHRFRRDRKKPFRKDFEKILKLEDSTNKSLNLLRVKNTHDQKDDPTLQKLVKMVNVTVVVKPDIVVIMPLHERPKILNHTLSGFNKLNTKPDAIFMYRDFGCLKSVDNLVSTIDIGIPISVYSRPVQDNKWKYHENFRFGQLRSLWWWAMNHVWVHAQPEQVCYFEDDMYPHSDFFKWMRLARKTAVRNKHWGMLGTSGGMYTPLCVTKSEWAYLVYNYEHFCFSDEWAWDMVLFRMHQHGPLPKLRLEASNAVAVHLGYTNADTYEKRQALISKLEENKVLEGKVAFEKVPQYAGKDFPKEYIDFNDRPPYKTNNNLGMAQTFNIVEHCFAYAQASRTMYRTKITFDSNFSYFASTDIKGNDIKQLKGYSVEQLKTICSEQIDCMGFVVLEQGDGWLKTAVDESNRIKLESGFPHLYVKTCNRLTTGGYCIQSYVYNEDRP